MPTDDVQRYLFTIDTKLDHVLAEIGELKTRVARIERGVAEIHAALAEHSRRMDRIDRRLGGLTQPTTKHEK